MPHDEPTPTSRPTRTAKGLRRVDHPAAFQFMAQESWLDFHCELYDVVSEMKLPVERIEPGVVRLVNGRSLPLLSLVEQCNDRPRDDWHGLIERYVSGMIDLLGSVRPTETPERSSIDLRVRLVPSTPIDAGMLAGLGARHVADGIAAVLSVAGPDGPETVSVDEVDAYGCDVDEAWESAWAQTKLLEEPDELDVVDIGGVDVIHLFGCSALTASLACSLEHHLGPLDDRGAIVGLPCDHTVLVHPIEGAASRPAIGTLVPIVRRLHADGPGALSPQLYWWQHGRLTWIPTVFGGETNEVYLPAGLGDVLS